MVLVGVRTLSSSLISAATCISKVIKLKWLRSYGDYEVNEGITLVLQTMILKIIQLRNSFLRSNYLARIQDLSLDHDN